MAFDDDTTEQEIDPEHAETPTLDQFDTGDPGHTDESFATAWNDDDTASAFEAVEADVANQPSVSVDPAILETALFEIKKVIVGQERMLERLLVCVLARGHCLLEGVPGVAKTLAVETLAKVTGGSFARLQFTPDLLPADIVGTPNLPGLKRNIRCRAGPGICELRPCRRDQQGARQGAIGAP